jgi:hypothetical protein
MEELAGMPPETSKDKLTELQLCALIALWTQPPAMVANSDLKKQGLNLDRPNRTRLEKTGLIAVKQERPGGPVFMQLTEAGRKRVDKHIDADLSAGTRCGAATLRLVLATLRPLLDRSARSAIGVGVQDQAVVTDLDMEERIRKAYTAVAKRPGSWVMLSRLRDAVGAVDRADVDAALIRLNRAPDVHIIPESNQKALTPAERAAAVSIGNQDRHAISIGS